MKCYFDCCLYNENQSCLLDEIEINSIGLCEDCIITEIPENELMRYKKEQLQRLDNSH